MPRDTSDPEWTGTPPHMKPFLHALDRMEERETIRPEQLGERAQALLNERFGPAAGAAAVAFAHGPLGVISDHTHYFDGFAVLMPLPQGVAVAVRTASGAASRVALEKGQQTATFDLAVSASAEPVTDLANCVIGSLARQGRLEEQGEMAVVSTGPDGCRDAYLAGLGVAVWRGLEALEAAALPTEETRTACIQAVRAAVAESTGYPFSLAYAIAAYDGRPGAFALADAGTLEQLALEKPSTQLGWGLVDMGTAPLHPPAFYREIKARAEEALAVLQKQGFSELTSLRDLEHRHLQQALSVLPPRLQPDVRYLVTENRRVQKLITAVRRRDWQMVGALLLMAHAARRSDAQATAPEIDFAIEQVEAMTAEGMYGACATGHGACVLVAGQSFVVPACLDQVRTSYAKRFDAAPHVMLL
ncbi:MAG: galactokinase [Rhodothermales bacterium]